MIIIAQVSRPITPTATTPHFIQDTSRLVISVSPGGGAGGGFGGWASTVAAAARADERLAGRVGKVTVGSSAWCATDFERVGGERTSVGRRFGRRGGRDGRRGDARPWRSGATAGATRSPGARADP